MNAFNKLPEIEREYLLRENNSLNEIKRFSFLFFVLKREMSHRITESSELNELLAAYKMLKIGHLKLMNVFNYSVEDNLNNLILKLLLKSKQIYLQHKNK